MDTDIIIESNVPIDNENIVVESEVPVIEESSLSVKKEIASSEANINLFVVIIVLFMGIGVALNWALLYLVRKKDNVDYQQEMQIALATAILDLIFTLILIFGLFVVWRYRRWNYISHVDRITYIVWLILTIMTFITMVINFWTFSNLTGTITAADLDNAKKSVVWSAAVFTTGVGVTIGIYAIRGFRAQIDNGLFYRSFRAMKEVRMKNAIQRYKV